MTPQEEAKTNEGPMCSELRCKGMYVTKDAAPANPMVIPGDTAHWWCGLTHYSIGPDKDWVHRTVCTSGRSCFRTPGNPS